MRNAVSILGLTAVVLLACPELAWADRIGDIAETSFGEQVKRFFSFRDPAVRYALLGSILLGVSVACSAASMWCAR